jgi:hypothetical protein
MSAALPKSFSSLSHLDIERYVGSIFFLNVKAMKPLVPNQCLRSGSGQDLILTIGSHKPLLVRFLQTKE